MNTLRRYTTGLLLAFIFSSLPMFGITRRTMAWDDWIVCSGWFHGIVTGNWDPPTTGRCSSDLQ